MTHASTSTVVGRYVLHAPIARGGMATIHLARLLGAEGFSRMVAAKRLHPQLTEDDEFVQMFLDEARIASKVHHPNVVPVLDVVQTGGEVILVQEYVHGLPLDKLLRAGLHQDTLLPVGVVVAIAADMLAGLAAAHEAKDELGTPLGVVHRDVSPQNVIVGVDGRARVLDFGVAKATLNHHVTQVGTFKGKLAYTSPEQLRGVSTPAIDVYAASVVIWEALAGRRLYPGLHDAELVSAVQSGVTPRLLDIVDPAEVPPERWAALVRLERGPPQGDGVRGRGAMGDGGGHGRGADRRRAFRDGRRGVALGQAARQGVPRGAREAHRHGGVVVAAARERGPRRAQRDRRHAAALGGPRGAAARGAPAARRVARLRGPRAPRRALYGRPRPAPAAARGACPWPAAPAPSGYEAAPPPLAEVVPVEPPAAAPASADPKQAPSPTASATAPGPTASAAPAVEVRPPPVRRALAAPRMAPAPPAAPSPPPAAHSTDCNPPFYFDGKKKVFKPGCL